MKLIYNVDDKPKFGQLIIFAIQQLLAIMAATLVVPVIVGNGMSSAAALFGAGVGTLIYVAFTKKKSPVFLGSSFAFIGSMFAAFAGATSMALGYLGIILGAFFAGLVYVVLAAIIKIAGSGWVNKLMPAVIAGPIVTIIGLSLSSTATGWMSTNGGADYSLVTILVGAITFFAIVIVSVKGSKKLRLIPFIIGVGAGYIFALILTLIGNAADIAALQILSFDSFKAAFDPFTIQSIVDYPKFTFLKAMTENVEGVLPIDATAVGNIAITFVPIAVVELAQHIADHKNLGNLIGKDLIKDPGLDRTLVGDGVGSIIGGFFGGAANTTYGESIGCVAITGNASVVSIITAGLGCMVLSFFTPFVALINSIPKCVMGGACVALYGLIAVSGLTMLKDVDLGKSKNLYIVSAILVVGIGGLSLNFGFNPITNGPLVQVTALATALIFGIITNLIVSTGKNKSDEDEDAE